MKENFKIHLPLFIAIIANVIVYIPVIVFYPGFITDDFLIYKLIASNSHQLITTNPQEEFFLFLRPISYFSFWLDFHLFGQNYYFIKLVNLSLHLIVIGLLYKILTKLINVFHLEKNNKVIFILLLFFSFHPDVHQWIFWIANRTELLGILFYFSSIYFIIKYLSAEKSFYLLASLICYILSILSKQIGLHLPLLLLYLLFLNNKYKLISIKNNYHLTLSLIVGLIIMVLTVFINTFFITSEASFFQNLWKKPFSLLGIFIYIFVPVHSQTLYNYFLFHKTFAFILMGIISFSLIILKRWASLSAIFHSIILLLIISFPRIVSAAGSRINTIYLLWVVICFYLIFVKCKNLWLPYSFTALFVIFSFTRMVFLPHNINKEHYVAEKFHRMVEKNIKFQLFTCSYPESIVLNDYYYYFINKSFGTYTKNQKSPVYFSYSLLEQSLPIKNKKFITVSNDNRIITVSSLDPFVHFYISSSIKNSKILSTKPDLSGRGYSEVTYELPKWLDLKKTKLIYFDGKDWLTLN